MTTNLVGNEFLDDKGYYKEPTQSDVETGIKQLIDMWEAFLCYQGESLTFEVDYYIQERNLYETVKRLDKRRTYYFVFHHISRICEYKEVAIMCYWINTLKPFMVVNKNSKIYNCPNEMFSLYLILSCLATIFESRFPGQKFVPPDKKTIQDYVYNFKYCDLSREAMIFFVETLAKSYGIGMETNSTNDKY